MKLTVREALDAIRRDGWKKAKGSYFEDWDFENDRRMPRNKIKAACAMGQAALNLGVDPSELGSRLGQFGISHRVYTMNDQTNSTLPEIADTIEKSLAPHILDAEFTIKKTNKPVVGPGAE